MNMGFSLATTGLWWASFSCRYFTLLSLGLFFIFYFLYLSSSFLFSLSGPFENKRAPDQFGLSTSYFQKTLRSLLLCSSSPSLPPSPPSLPPSPLLPFFFFGFFSLIFFLVLLLMSITGRWGTPCSCGGEICRQHLEGFCYLSLYYLICRGSVLFHARGQPFHSVYMWDCSCFVFSVFV